MAKIKPEFTLVSYGIYSSWEEQSKDLPQILSFTTDVKAVLDVEFGYIINVKKGKGIKLNFFVYHPDIPDKNGAVMEPFTGDVYVKNNDWSFYLGDTIWEPIDNKLGNWRFVIEYNGKKIADKTFELIDEKNHYADDYATFMKRKRSNYK